MPEPCPHHRDASPENPAYPWCARHRFHLDDKGYFCGRCRDDPGWRERLALQSAARCRAQADDAGPSADGPPFLCPRYDIVADADLCRRCRDDPELKAFLHGQAEVRRQAARVVRAAAGVLPRPLPVAGTSFLPLAQARRQRLAGCAARGELLRHEEVRCCGGQRRNVAIHRCRLRGEAHEARCADCPRWRPPEPPPTVPREIHHDATALG